MNEHLLAAAGPSRVPSSRRELATRRTGWANALASRLGHAGCRPNGISVAGVAFAAAGGVCLWVAPDLGPRDRSLAFLLAAATIQLRLVCNLLDGMLAVEHGLKSKTGEVYNDLPDRVADILILVGAGYSARHLAGGVSLGWFAAVLAVFTAYVRLLGGSQGLPQDFAGPMAKQHRMFAVTVAALLSALEAAFGLSPRAMRVGLVLIAAGTVVTAWRRTRRILLALGAQ